MKRCFFFSALTAGGLISQSMAGTMGPVMPAKDWTWVGSVSAGPVWARGGETQTFFLAPEIEKTYVARKSSNALAAGELFLGIQKSLTPQWLGQLGV
ncbi:TPA: porin family protein, partial [Legionella anisa]